MKKILLIGATGFIGKHLAKNLSQKRYYIRCLVRKDSKKDDVNFLKSLGAEIFMGDVFDRQSLFSAMKGIYAIFNLVGGGYVSSTFGKGYESLKKLNIESARNVFEIADKSKVKKFIHFSSISAMGIVTERKLDENSECSPRTPHEICKLETEKIAGQFKKKMLITILRPGIVFGSYGVNSEILQLSKLMKKHFFIIPGSGKNLMPWVCVDEVVDSAILAFEKNKKSCEKFIIVSSPEPTFNELISFIKTALGVKVLIIHIPKIFFISASFLLEKIGNIFSFEPLINSTRAKSMTSNRIYSIAKIKSLGYVSKTNIKEDINKTVNWYKENGYL
jgi:dihydroflavonol-4-reductase